MSGRQTTTDFGRVAIFSTLHSVEPWPFRSPPPRSIDLTGLESPFDGKPLKYTFDGKQMVFEVSGYAQESEPILLKLPPDEIKP